MRRAVHIASIAVLLGCSGFAESVAEWVSGSEIEVEGDRVVLTNADGSRQVITQGEHAEAPADFPLPLPPGQPTLDSVVAPEGKGASTLSYRLGPDDDAEAVVAFYTEWFAAEGIEVMSDHKNMAGMRTTALVGSRSGEVYSVTFTDALGTRMLTLTVTPAR
ncbi:MAG: hypothetical protein R3F61_21745 [Myxococcota bacterium]